MPKELPGVPVSKDRATAQPPGGETVAASTGAGKHFSEDSAQSTQVKVVKEQPVDLSAQASLGSAPPPAGASADAGVIPPAAEHSGATKIDASPVTAQHARPPAQSPDPNPARTISLRSGGTPIATFAATSIESWSLADVPIPPHRPALEAANDAVGTAQSSMPRLVLLTKRPGKSPTPVVLAKPEAITSAEAETRSQSIPPGTPAKSEKPAGGRDIPQATVAFRSIGQGLFRRLDVRWLFAFRSFCIRPLETIGSLIARAATSPLWRVEGAGIARPACPSSRSGRGQNIHGRSGGSPLCTGPRPQTPRSHQETWADCLTRTFAPTWTRS